MTYSPPYIYNGLYEEEQKSFEIVGEVRHEQLIHKPDRSVCAEGNMFVSPHLAFDSDVTTRILSDYSLSVNVANQSATHSMIVTQLRGIEIARQMTMRKTRRGDGTGALA